MKIILIGNIGTGKTTVSLLIKENYSNAEVIAIDNIRKQFGDGSKEMEAKCKNIFIESIALDRRLQIIELTGVGELGKRLFILLGKMNTPVLVINLIVENKEIMKRLNERIWNTPFHFDISNIPIAIRYTREKYRTGLLESLMKKCQHAVFITLSNSNTNLMHRNIDIICHNIDLIKKMNNSENE